MIKRKFRTQKTGVGK